MISNLSDEQKQWVNDTGFGSLLNFNLQKLPLRLAYNIFKSFDAASRSLNIASGIIPITDRDIHDVLGLPAGPTPITLFAPEVRQQRKILWLEQFDKQNSYTILPSTVIEKMNKQEVDELFKLNFIMVMSNILIERNTTSYVNRDILEYDIDIDHCAQYNWGEFVLRSLVKTKNE